MLEVLVLGPVELRATGGGPIVLDRPLERALATRLALAGGAAVADERLARDLWGEVPLARPAQRLRVLSSRLRANLGAAAPALTRSSAGYALAAVATDLVATERAAGQMRAAARARDSRAVHAAASDALAQWRGPALADLRTVPFGAAEGDRIDALQLELQVERLDADLALGRSAGVVTQAERLAAEHPLHERLRGLLALALYRSGRQAEALDQIAQLKETLAEELGVDPTPETVQLQLRLLQQDPTLAAPQERRSALPAPHLRAVSTTFVGRAAERSALLEELANPGLVTLLGMAGSGKTRLATETALGVRAGGRDIAMVDLTVLRDPDAVVPAFALAAGVELESTDPLPQCAEALGEALLVVDNAEHVIDAVAGAISGLLRYAPGLSVLVTSQRPLLITGEELRHVGPLAPAAAAALFCERSRVARDADVDAICAAVDRLPLGIELAAGLTRTMTVPQLASRISDRVRLLVGGSRNNGPRHTSLRAALDWSYQLLDPPTQAVLRRLAVFAGGCTLEAAEAVTAGDGVAVADVAAALAELIDRSLVITDTDGDTRRFGLLETVRDYGWHQLRSTGEETAVRNRHLAWATRFCTNLNDSWHERAQIVPAFIAELANLVTALDYAPTGSAPGEGLRLAVAIDDVWIEQGTPHQAIRHYSALIDAPDVTDVERAFALSNYAYACAVTGQLAKAVALLDRAEPLASAAGDQYLVMRVLFHRGVAEIESGEPARAMEVLQRGLPIAVEHGLQSHSAFLDAIAGADVHAGQIEAGLEAIVAGITIDRGLGRDHNLARGLARLVDVHLARGDVLAAVGHMPELDKVATDVNDLETILNVRSFYGRIARHHGDLEAAIEHFRVAISGGEASVDHDLSRIELADALLQAGRPDEAAEQIDALRFDTADHGLAWVTAQPTLATLALARGDANAAIEIVEQAETEYAKRGFGWPPAVARLAQARAALP